MDEHGTLNHLIEVEKNAAKIVEDAQKDAAARIAENERTLRLNYDALWSKEFAALEAAYKSDLENINSAYLKELDVRRAALNNSSANKKAFFCRARQFLFEAMPNGASSTTMES